MLDLYRAAKDSVLDARAAGERDGMLKGIDRCIDALAKLGTLLVEQIGRAHV